jgi:DNA-binding SARP family transcriptional activator
VGNKVAGLKADLQSRGLQFDMLLSEGRYARLADRLFDLQTAVEQTDQSDLINLTAAALQLSMFCQQCQMEMEWHSKANQEIRLRLRELEGQLSTLLKSIVDYELGKDVQFPNVSVNVTLLQDRIPPEVKERPTLWQRIRDLFNFEPVPPNPEQQMTQVVVNTSFPSVIEKDDPVIHVGEIAEELKHPTIIESEASAPSTTEESGVNRPIKKNVETVEGGILPTVADPENKREEVSVAPIEKNAQNQKTHPSFLIYCLGSFRVYQNDQPVQEWPSSKGKSIFKYLIAQRKHPMPKEVLMELFWPGTHPDAARNNLNVSIYGLRQALRTINPKYSHILFQEQCYLLNPDMELWIDVEEFNNRIQLGRQKENRGEIALAMQEYRAAEALYQGEFLAEDRYEDWLVSLRQGLQDDYLKLLDCLSRYYLEQKDITACVAVCTKMLGIDPCREEAHRQLMRCYSCQGQPYLALRQFHICLEALERELEVTPMEKTVSLYKRIRTGEAF